jgi:hypothetical protein
MPSSGTSQGDQIVCAKTAQNVAQPILSKNEYISFSVVKRRPKNFGYSCNNNKKN